MKKLLLVIPLSILITACGAPSVADFKVDPDLLRRANIECRRLAASGESIDIDKCNNATQAAKELSSHVKRVK